MFAVQEFFTLRYTYGWKNASELSHNLILELLL